MPKRSCASKLTYCTVIWTKALDAGAFVHVVYMVYLDLTKAFDSVPHQRLAIKLGNMGIQGNIPQWVQKFLDGRSQSVKVESSQTKSTSKSLCFSQLNFINLSIRLYWRIQDHTLAQLNRICPWSCWSTKWTVCKCLKTWSKKIRPQKLGDFSGLLWRSLLAGFSN
jgi:hypothetical protein